MNTYLNKKKLFDLGNQSIWLLRLGVSVLAVLFAKYVIFYPFSEFLQSQINNISYIIILKIMIVVLVNSKLYGSIIDIREIQRELIKIRYKKFPIIGYILLVCFLGSLSLMIILHSHDITLYSLSYLFFLIIYMIFWQLFRPFINQSIINTFRLNRKNEIEKLQNKIIWKYFNDNWPRDIRNLSFVLTIIALFMIETEYENNIMGFMNIDSPNLISSIILLSSVFISELIIWTKRLKRKYQIRYLDQNYVKIQKNFTNKV